jgi:hypothetical protein
MAGKVRARKRRTIVEEELPSNSNGDLEPEVNELDVQLESVQDTETLKEVLEQFGVTDQVLYRIYRQTPTGQAFCYESPTYDEAFLQRERGEGSYAVRIFINGRFKRTIPVMIDAPSNNSAKPNGIPTDSHTQFLEKMLMVLLTQQHQNGNGSNPGPTIIDLTTALSNLDGLRGKQETAMDMFLKGAEFAKGMGGDVGDWKQEGLKMVRDAIPAITSVVNSHLSTGPVPGHVPQSVSQQPNPTGDVMMVDLDNLTEDQRNTILKKAIVFLKKQFLMGLDPEFILNYIVVNANDPEYQAVITSVLRIQYEDLVKLDPDLGQKPFNEQFRALYDGLRSEFDPSHPVEGDPGGIDGNDDHPGNDGDTGKKRKS